jgi:putative ABC transport system ATP-binding protein
MITVSNISKHYPAHHVQALQSVSFTIDAGKTVALIGPSGCGKSTLLNVLAGIDTVDGGQVVVDGVGIHSADEKALTEFRQKHIGVVFQFFNLLENLTVFENVSLPLQIQGGGSAACIKKRVDFLLDAVGLSERADFYPSQLSGGQMQRVAIARALVHRPAVVLADEPTGNLDSKTGQKILSLLKTLCTDEGTTLVIATHSHEVVAICDEVLQLDDGCLITETAA